MLNLRDSDSKLGRELVDFEIEGPFELYRTEHGLIDASAATKRLYWEWVDEYQEGLSDACGCYIFVIKASGTAVPWYVGKAEKQSFRKECFAPHKINHYNNAVASRRRGKPQLYFVPQVTKRGKYRKPTSSKRPAIAQLETLLLGMAISANPEILNTHGTKWFQSLTVDGLVNSSMRRGGASRELRRILKG